MQSQLPHSSETITSSWPPPLETKTSKRLISAREKLAVCYVTTLPYMDVNWQSMSIHFYFWRHWPPTICVRILVETCHSGIQDQTRSIRGSIMQPVSIMIQLVTHITYVTRIRVSNFWSLSECRCPTLWSLCAGTQLYGRCFNYYYPFFDIIVWRCFVI